jgi:general secretion pathway protein D
VSVGAVALGFRIPSFRVVAMSFGLVLSACQTTESQPVEPAWGSAPVASAGGQAYARSARAASRFGGSPLLADTRGGNSTVIEGAGRFVGEPPTGSLSAAQTRSPMA